MKKPEHLINFRCMEPWIGCRYGANGTRLAIVGESHYLPPNVTCKNYSPSTWYSITQHDVPNTNVGEVTAHTYMNTAECVRRRFLDGHPTYREISCVVNFDDIAFLDYVLRPAEEGKPGYASTGMFDILDQDRMVSTKVMEWFIRTYKPTAIILTSYTVMRWTCIRNDLHRHKEIAFCVTMHPMACRSNFQEYARKFISDTSWYSPANKLPSFLNKEQKSICLRLSESLSTPTS